MPYVLKLSDSSSTDVVDFLGECVGDPWCQLEDNGLMIEQPEKTRLFAGSGVSRRGLELSSTLYKNRDIIIKFEVGGSDRDSMLDMRNKINRILEDARESQASRQTETAYLEFQLDNVTDPVYFDVIDGSLDIPEEFMSVEGMGWIKCVDHNVIKGCILKLDCKPFARGDEVQIVSGGSVDNESGGGSNNYVSWGASTVKGDVPGPLRVRFTNGSSAISKWWLGMRDVGSDLSAWVTVLEGESATPVYPGSSTSSSGSASGGSARDWTGITPPTTSDSKMCYWTIPARSQMLNYGGKARAVAVGYFSPDFAYRLESNHLGITALHSYKYRSSDVVRYNLDLGTIDMNPWGVRREQGSDSWRLYFYARNLTGMPGSVTIDAIYLIPANDYKFRSWVFKGYSLSNGETVEDIGIYDQVARGTSFKASLVDYKGLPLHARPNNDGRLYFVWVDEYGDYDATFNGTVNVWHTPYYLDLRGGSS